MARYVAVSSKEYLKRRAIKNVISSPPNPPKKQKYKNQEYLTKYKRKLIAYGTVHYKRKIYNITANPRKYPKREAVKNVIPPQTPPKKQQYKN